MKEMTAGVLHGGSTGATEVVKETIEVVREL